MSTAAPPEIASSYEGYDFRREWRGREAVTRLEAALIADALDDLPRGRLLESGTGFGRLSAEFSRRSEEYVGADLDAGEFSSVRVSAGRGRAGAPELLVQANLFHLPFARGTFSSVASIRVYHHIVDPAGFLREIHRVLAPAGHLLLSYAPRPTLGTLEQDLRSFLAEGRTAKSLDGRPELPRGASAFPIVVPTRARVVDDLRRAGFTLLREFGEGPERLAQYLPVAMNARLGAAFPSSFLFPHRFLLARRDGAEPPALPNLSAAFACPRCEAVVPPQPVNETWSHHCSSCGQLMGGQGAVVRAVYLPGELRRKEPGVPAIQSGGSTLSPDPSEGS